MHSAGKGFRRISVLFMNAAGAVIVQERASHGFPHFVLIAIFADEVFHIRPYFNGYVSLGPAHH